jgi:hypothetical protein
MRTGWRLWTWTTNVRVRRTVPAPETQRWLRWLRTGTTDVHVFGWSSTPEAQWWRLRGWAANIDIGWRSAAPKSKRRLWRFSAAERCNHGEKRLLHGYYFLSVC